MQIHDTTALKPRNAVPSVAVDKRQRFSVSAPIDKQALVKADRGWARCSPTTTSNAEKPEYAVRAAAERSANFAMANSSDAENSSISASRSLWGRDMVELYPLAIGGLTRFSSVDYPGCVAAVVSCQHSKRLSTTRESVMPWHEIADWLDNRHGLLDAVVFSGGEPLHQRGLVGALWQVRDMGYRVAVHTAGIYPDRLAGAMPLIDWIGFDLKGPFRDYPRLTGTKSGEAAQRALSFVLASGKPHEIRCAVDETVLGIDDASRMAREIAEMGASRLVLQAKNDSPATGGSISPDYVNAMARWIDCTQQRVA